MRTFVVGDLHGCFDEFIELSKRIGIVESDLVISVGDIVDRGNKSVELYRYFKNRRNSIVLMGNHERKHQRGILSYSQEIVKVQFSSEYNDFLKWTETLPYYYETKEALIVHAFFEHDKKLQEQKKDVLAGTTSGAKYLESRYEKDEFWTNFYNGAKPIIYGHHVVGENPKIQNNTFGIDTGACHGGMLTIIELPHFKIHQIKVKKDYWEEEQVKWQVPVLEAKEWERMKISQIHKQVEKLSYKNEKGVKLFLANLKQWLADIEDLMVIMIEKLERMATDLKTRFPDSFNLEAGKLPFRTFIFKAGAGNLTFQNIQKTLDTPEKVFALATQLEIDDRPSWKR